MMRPLQRGQWIFLLLAAVLIGWFSNPQTEPAPALINARTDRWELAALPTQSDASSLALRVATSNLWGPELKAAQEAPIENQRWRLAGVYGSGKVGGVLVLFEDERKAPQRLSVGEKLPSGHVIEAVDGNQVCIRIEKKLYRFGVERRE
ncbi:hypothetical protein OOZ63_25150 [Paucibacter sp. PLA-PC-4]|uniref:hypothetical protein n=1 Tax=Paucibacter sp. PLA-PC-4 TaxID=2993655 RepID=UPI00224B0D83|nr:hypothetical protein [Paucibacter sp. PLA-PC-4]MCX2865120.1 hypothetical protein [Paucibacter sp. PLA-PC-4]